MNWWSRVDYASYIVFLPGIKVVVAMVMEIVRNVKSEWDLAIIRKVFKLQS